jgi:predicted dehydrogenase
MNEKTIRVGILSVAHMHAASYAHSLNRLPGVELAGIWNEDAVFGREVAARFDTTFFASAEELLAQKLDAVVICSANVNHRPLVELAAGKVGAILCEKPIATTVADGQAIIDVCRRTNTRLQIAFPVRFAPTVQEMKRRLDAGELGEVYSATCTNHGSMPGSWFIEPALSGGGAVIDHTVHVIDLLRWFWGAEVTEVYAEVGDSLLHPGLGIDDAGMLSFTLANGVFGTLDTSWSRPHSYPIWGDVKIELVGSRGTVVCDALHQYVAVSSDADGQTRWASWASDMDHGLICDFVDMVRAQRAPFISGEDGLRAVEVALAAYESARIGQPVKLR